MGTKKATAPAITNADVEAIRTSLEEQLGEPKTGALDVLEQVSNTAPPKKPPTKATKSEPKHRSPEFGELQAEAQDRVISEALSKLQDQHPEFVQANCFYEGEDGGDYEELFDI